MIKWKKNEKIKKNSNYLFDCDDFFSFWLVLCGGCGGRGWGGLIFSCSIPNDRQYILACLILWSDSIIFLRLLRSRPSFKFLRLCFFYLKWFLFVQIKDVCLFVFVVFLFEEKFFFFGLEVSSKVEWLNCKSYDGSFKKNLIILLWF